MCPGLYSEIPGFMIKKKRKKNMLEHDLNRI